MSEKTVTHKRNIAAAAALVLLAALLIVCVQPPTQVRAKAVTTIRKRQNLRMNKLTPALKRRIAASTPAEPADSDLVLRYPAARLTTARLPQGYTHDSTY